MPSESLLIELNPVYEPFDEKQPESGWRIYFCNDPVYVRIVRQRLRYALAFVDDRYIKRSIGESHAHDDTLVRLVLVAVLHGIDAGLGQRRFQILDAVVSEADISGKRVDAAHGDAFVSENIG